MLDKIFTFVWVSFFEALAADAVSLFRYPRENEGRRIIEAPWVERVGGARRARHTQEEGGTHFQYCFKMSSQIAALR